MTDEESDVRRVESCTGCAYSKETAFWWMVAGVLGSLFCWLSRGILLKWPHWSFTQVFFKSHHFSARLLSLSPRNVFFFLRIFFGQKTFQDTGSGSGYSGYRRLSYGVDYIDADEIAEEAEAFPRRKRMRWGVDGLGFLVEGKKMGSPKISCHPQQDCQGVLMKNAAFWVDISGFVIL